MWWISSRESYFYMEIINWKSIINRKKQMFSHFSFPNTYYILSIRKCYRAAILHQSLCVLNVNRHQIVRNITSISATGTYSPHDLIYFQRKTKNISLLILRAEWLFYQRKNLVFQFSPWLWGHFYSFQLINSKVTTIINLPALWQKTAERNAAINPKFPKTTHTQTHTYTQNRFKKRIKCTFR